MKTKKNILAGSLAIMFIALFATSIVSADTTITSVEYPESILEGESIDITAYFKYDSFGDYLLGPAVYLEYSINELSIDGLLFVKHTITLYSRATYLSFAIPTTTLVAGDVIRFRIKYLVPTTDFLTLDSDIEYSKTYRINVKGIDQTSLSALGIGIALIMITAIITTKKQKLTRV